MRRGGGFNPFIEISASRFGPGNFLDTARAGRRANFARLLSSGRSSRHIITVAQKRPDPKGVPYTNF